MYGKDTEMQRIASLLKQDQYHHKRPRKRKTRESSQSRNCDNKSRDHREIQRCCTPGLQDRGRGQKTRNVGSLWRLGMQGSRSLLENSEGMHSC